MSTKTIGKEGELRFAAEFIRNGWEVFIPSNENGPIDLVIYKNGVFKKVQVKTTKIKNNKIKVKLRSTNNWQNKIYTKKDIDIVAVYDYENKKGYIVNIGKCSGMSEISLRTAPSKNNQQKRIRPVNNHLYFK